MKEKTQLLAILDGDARDLYTKLATIWCGVSTENAEGPRLLWRLRRFRLALLAGGSVAFSRAHDMLQLPT